VLGVADRFEEESWLGGEEVGFHQPLMTARNPTCG
jgi:hypothetical protein